LAHDGNTPAVGGADVHSDPVFSASRNPSRKGPAAILAARNSLLSAASVPGSDAYMKRFEMGVPITNDSDLAEPVRIGILTPHQFHSRELRQHATFIKRIRRGELASSQFPRMVTDHKGTFAKPAGW
jgi:hypothetical protein